MKKYLEDPVLNLTATTLKALRWLMLVFMGFAIFAAVGGSFAMFVTDGTVFTNDDETRTFFGVMVPAIPLCYLTAKFFELFRCIVLSVGQGQPLTIINAKRLRFMGLLVLTLQLVLIAASVALTFTVGNKLFDAESVTDLIESILIAAVLFILARVFEHGARMQDELEGTV